MAELADAHGSGPCDSNIMRVRVPFPALAKRLGSTDKSALPYFFSFYIFILTVSCINL